MKHSLFFFKVVGTALVTGCLATAATAQVRMAAVGGQVTDGANHAIENATVTVDGGRQAGKTNAGGQYELQAVSAGLHTITFSHVGYINTTQRFRAVPGQQAVVNATLQATAQGLNDVVITASGLKQKSLDFPGTINVITQTKIKESGAQSVGEAARLIPGANFLDEDGRGLKPSIGLRGLDPQRNRNLLILVDGKFPIGQSYYGDLGGYYTMPLDQVDRIEVIKGASPVLYGGGSLGGVVNLITKTGKTDPRTGVNFSYGSYNNMNLDVSTSGNKGSNSWYIGYNRKQGDGFRTSRSHYRLNDLTVKYENRSDSNTILAVYLDAFGEKSQTPGGLNQAQFDADYRQSVNQHDEFIGSRFSGAVSYTKVLNGIHTISASAYGGYFQRDWWIEEKTKHATDNGALRDIPSVGLVADYKLTQPLGNFKNTLIVGGRIHTDRTNSQGVDGTTPDARTGKISSASSAPSLISEAYVYDELNITPELVFSPGVRYTNVHYKKSDEFKGRLDKVTNDAFIYSFGLLYKLPQDSRVYATFSKGYQPPQLGSALSFGTIDAGVDLGPETSNNLELGVRTRPASWVSADIDGYLMYFNNKIVSEAGINRNTGKSFHRGIEADITFYPATGFSLYITGALQKATFKNGADEGKLLPYAPKTTLNGGARYQFAVNQSSFTLNVFNSYVGKQYNDSKNTEAGTADGMNGAIPAYNLLNATVNFNYHGFGINFNAMNILDRHYFTQRYRAWGGIMPAPGRNFMAGVSYHF